MLCALLPSVFGNGGGVSAAGNSNILGCTLAGNGASSGGGFAGEETLLERAIIWGNCADNQAHEMDSGDNIILDCCCVDATGMLGTVQFAGPLVTDDPLFCGPFACSLAPTVGGDYSLEGQSPCLPANSPCFSQIGAIGEGCAPTSVAEDDVAVHDELSLPAVFPGTVQIDLSIAAFGHTRLSVHDIYGRRLTTLVDGSLAPGLPATLSTARPRSPFPRLSHPPA